MRMHQHIAMAVALAAAAGPILINMHGAEAVAEDPYRRKSRSKGEKARNRKYRGRS